MNKLDHLTPQDIVSAICTQHAHLSKDFSTGPSSKVFTFEPVKIYNFKLWGDDSIRLGKCNKTINLQHLNPTQNSYNKHARHS